LTDHEASGVVGGQAPRSNFFNFLNFYNFYSIRTRTPFEWLENSGAYMHCAVVIPFEKSPRSATTSGYSNTNVPRGR
jgi:hypothetical protein